MKQLKISKNMKDNIITYGIVAVAFLIVEIMLKTGNMSSLMEGLLVPLCTYVILAISLNEQNILSDSSLSKLKANESLIII